MAKNYEFFEVALSDIENVDRNNLKNSRLDDLLNGFNTFEEVLSDNASGDPIALYSNEHNKPPYSISDGRHRIYLARQKGYKKIKIIFV
jgi:hypothetical protein